MSKNLLPPLKKPKTSDNPLFSALIDGDRDTLKELLEQDSTSVNAYKNGQTLLHFALKSITSNERILDCLNTLLGNGADILLKDQEGRAALDIISDMLKKETSAASASLLKTARNHITCFIHNRVVKITRQDETVLYAAGNGQDEGWTRISPESNKDGIGLFSFGFLSCVALIVKSPDNGYISLYHIGADDFNRIDKLISDEIDDIQEDGNYDKIDVNIAFSLDTYKESLELDLKDGASQEQVETEKEEVYSVLNKLIKKYQPKGVINMPHELIYISPHGSIQCFENEKSPEFILRDVDKYNRYHIADGYFDFEKYAAQYPPKPTSSNSTLTSLKPKDEQKSKQ
jgi:hypothetical protein